MIELNKIYQGDSQSVLKTFPERIFNTCVTSPPYYGLRAYGTDPVIWDGNENCQHEWIDNSYVRNNDKTAGEKQQTNVGAIGRDVPIKNDFCAKCGAWRGELGSEPSPELFIKHLVSIFKEVKRTLRDDGTIWVNMGDSYWGGKGQSSQAWSTKNQDRDTLEKSQHQIAGKGQTRTTDKKHSIIKPKDLIGIPWMLAFALRASGWYLRQDIIWHKPNPMPESVTDRCTKSHEYIFLMSKSQKYYFDHEAIQEEAVTNIPNHQGERGTQGYATASGVNGSAQRSNSGGYGYSYKNLQDKGQPNHSFHESRAVGIPDEQYVMRNKRDVWTVNTMPYKEAHFATFPEKLIVDMIKAGCPKDGIVLDPFGGANTTGVVSRKLNRNYVAIELNPEYIKISNKRVHEEIGLFI